MKPEHTQSHDAPHAKSQTMAGVYRQPIYSPKGELEGVLLEVGGESTQVVLDPKKDAAAFEGVAVGQRIELDAAPAKPSSKGEAVHTVFHFHALVSVDGRKPAAVGHAPRRFEGKVARLNYAKHGEPNGVVLDSGDFIHLRPQGFRAVGLKVGDAVKAEGAAMPMVGGGMVVEATQVNGVAIEPKKPAPHHKPKHDHGPKRHPAHHAH